MATRDAVGARRCQVACLTGTADRRQGAPQSPPSTSTEMPATNENSTEKPREDLGCLSLLHPYLNISRLDTFPQTIPRENAF